MARDPRYDLLFEPVRIGPVTAKNRFYQVPHCNGMGHVHPQALAAMRGVKAQGGWAVVSTEEVSLHPTSDLTPCATGRLWDDHDVPALAMMTDAVHEHGALAALQLAHNGCEAANLYSREVPLGPSNRPVTLTHPQQVRAMDRQDIAAFRRWHREAALRGKKAGFDIIYVYAGHDMALPMHFLVKRRNDRIDEYGGSLENRARLLRELIEDTKEAVGDSCAVAVRFAVDELLGSAGLSAESEGRELVEMLAEMPDLWDVNISHWDHDSAPSRFAQEGFQERFVAFVKAVTTKPVVGVGRFTSPDTMVRQVKQGILDFIGAARPSIADPFLPKKIEEGRLDDIRECIGCNMCVTADWLSTPLRCTQNPTMGEEWRRGWHPEHIAPKLSDRRILVVGAGPAGLEAARALGQRGYEVHLAEAATELGGRVAREARLPGLAEWSRVRDWRVHQLSKMPNVSIYLDSRLSADDIREFEAERVVIATGAVWRRDGIGRASGFAVPGTEGGKRIFTPDDIMDGRLPTECPIVVFDDDHYYMAATLSEKLAAAGSPIVAVTPEESVASWTRYTLEFAGIQKRLRDLGVQIVTGETLTSFDGECIELTCVYTGNVRRIAAHSLVTVTARLPCDDLYLELVADKAALEESGIRSITRIGDCLAPATIAAAVYGGYRYARELDNNEPNDLAFRRSLPLHVTPHPGS